MRIVPALLALAVSAGLAAAAASCGTNANGVDACKSIEEARCQQAPGCPNVQITPPLYYTSGSAVDACIRYYDTACGHGLVTPTTPSSAEVSQCVAAINTGNCDWVANPQDAPACAWLEPPDSGEDAEAGEAATDAATDATDGG